MATCGTANRHDAFNSVCCSKLQMLPPRFDLRHRNSDAIELGVRCWLRAQDTTKDS